MVSAKEVSVVVVVVKWSEQDVVELVTCELYKLNSTQVQLQRQVCLRGTGFPRVRNSVPRPDP